MSREPIICDHCGGSVREYEDEYHCVMRKCWTCSRESVVSYPKYLLPSPIKESFVPQRWTADQNSQLKRMVRRENVSMEEMIRRLKVFDEEQIEHRIMIMGLRDRD